MEYLYAATENDPKLPDVCNDQNNTSNAKVVQDKLASPSNDSNVDIMLAEEKL